MGGGQGKDRRVREGLQNQEEVNNYVAEQHDDDDDEDAWSLDRVRKTL